MSESADRYEVTYEELYGSGTNGVITGGRKFYQVITAHTQSKSGSSGKLTDADMYMSMLYAAAHDVAGYSWFCYFPILAELSASMVGFDGEGYGNGNGLNGAEDGKSYYDTAKNANYLYELIQGLLDGYTLQTRSDSKNKLVTTLSNESGRTATIYVNADTIQMSESITVTASGTECYLVGLGVGTAEAPYQTVSGEKTLAPGQALICLS